MGEAALPPLSSSSFSLRGRVDVVIVVEDSILWQSSRWSVGSTSRRLRVPVWCTVAAPSPRRRSSNGASRVGLCQGGAFFSELQEEGVQLGWDRGRVKVFVSGRKNVGYSVWDPR